MFTYKDANEMRSFDLDERLKKAVKHSTADRSAEFRGYADDWFCYRLEEELASRGFKVDENYRRPVTSCDVTFTWE